MNRATLLALVLIAAVAAPAVAQTSGGLLHNVAPEASASFVGDQGVVTNSAPREEVYSFSITDDNGDDTLLSVRVQSTDATFGTRTCNDVAASTTCSDWSFQVNGDEVLFLP